MLGLGGLGAKKTGGHTMSCFGSWSSFLMPKVNFWPKIIGATIIRCLAIFINIFGSNKMIFLLYFRVRRRDIWEGLCNFWIFKKICDVDDDLIWQRQNEKLTSGKRLVLSILDTLSILNILSIFSILTAGMAGALDMFRKKGGGEADQVRLST